MKRTSDTLFLESHGSFTPLPWVNDQPVFDGFAEPTLSVLQNAWTDFVASGAALEVIPDPVPVAPNPDWNQLLQQLLSGELYPIYARLTAASFVVDPSTASQPEIANANNIAVAAGKLDQAVQVTKLEAAVAAAVNLLLSTSNYVFTTEEKTLWNATIASLGFSAVMELQ